MQPQKGNKIVESMEQVDFSELKLPLITVYEKPTDFPDAFVARVWDGVGAKATNIIITRPSLQEIQEDIKAAGFTVKFPRAEDDEIHIVETWMR